VLQALLILLVLLPLTGCGTPIYPVTYGSHAPNYTAAHARFLVWSNHLEAGHYIEGILLANGHPVVERARLQQVFEEQKIQLVHTPEDQGTLLRIGRIVGATQMIFVEVKITGSSWMMDSDRDLLGVSVRDVDVESGEILWSGLAQFSAPVNNSDPRVEYLIALAMNRAECRVEAGYRWEDPSESHQASCMAPR